MRSIRWPFHLRIKEMVVLIPLTGAIAVKRLPSGGLLLSLFLEGNSSPASIQGK
jgi:hypothetical protein